MQNGPNLCINSDQVLNIMAIRLYFLALVSINRINFASAH